MGFFTDLKDDLSQAVNELKPADGKAVGDTAIPEAAEETVGEDNSKGQIVTPLKELSNISHTDTESYDRKEDGSGGGMASDELAVITAGMTINGDITSEGSVELIGTVIGNINILGKLNVTGYIHGDSKAVEVYAENAQIYGELSSQGGVRIGNGSVIIGNIFASSAVISGAVKGDIDIHGPVLLDSTAIVMGNIRSQSIQINNGAVIEGMCSQCYSEVRPSDFFEEFNKGKR